MIVVKLSSRKLARAVKPPLSYFGTSATTRRRHARSITPFQKKKTDELVDLLLPLAVSLHKRLCNMRLILSNNSTKSDWLARTQIAPDLAIVM